MTQLFLDGMEAALQENASIKFNSENPFFTKTASYTYEVELPLAAAPNRAIFGNIDRIDVEKDTRKMTARLVVDNRLLLAGTAYITSVSNTSVKVQLLGSSSAYNYGNKMDKLFIDELEMGDWFTTTYPDRYPAGYTMTGNTAPIISEMDNQNGGSAGRPGIDGSEPTSPSEYKATLPMGEQPWVAFPVYNSTAGIICNTYAYFETSKDSRQYNMEFRPYHGSRRSRDEDKRPVDNFAVQPYVWIIAEKVAAATGFTLKHTDNYLYTNSFFKRIFIVNANNFIECRRCLPHWSVNEFWTEVENTFGVVLTIDYADMSMKLLSRGSYYKDTSRSSMNYIDMVLDEFSAEVDDETKTDISVNNVGFADFDHGSEDLLSDYILDNAEEYTGFADAADILAMAGSQTGDRKEQYKRTIFKSDDGRQYIYASDCAADAGDRTETSATAKPPEDTNGGRWEVTRPVGKGEGVAEVNMFRPRIARTDSEDVDIKLRFVPARHVSVDANVYEYRDRHSGVNEGDVPVASFPVTALEKPDIGDLSWYRSKYEEDIDLEALINGEADEEDNSTESSDLIYIAIDNPELDSITAELKLSDKEKFTRTLTHPRAILRERTLGLILDGVTVTDPGVSLALVPMAGQRNLASETVVESVTIDTLTLHCIKFIATSVPDVSKIFNIRNRLFVCEKIEADIALSGLRRLITGYFYEIKL